MPKLWTFLLHRDAGTAKRLCGDAAQLGRDLFDGVVAGRGREKIRQIVKRWETWKVKEAPKPFEAESKAVLQVVNKQNHLQAFGSAWRKFLVNYSTKSQTNNYFSRLRQQNAFAFGSWRSQENYYVLGRRLALFGFIGVSVSSQWQKTGFSNNEDMTGIETELRNMFPGKRDLIAEADEEPLKAKLENLELGNRIANGCYTAVFAAKLRPTDADLSTPTAATEMGDRKTEVASDAVVEAVIETSSEPDEQPTLAPADSLEQSVDEVMQLVSEEQCELVELRHRTLDQNAQLEAVLALQSSRDDTSQLDMSAVGLEEAVMQQQCEQLELHNVLYDQHVKLKNLVGLQPSADDAPPLEASAFNDWVVLGEPYDDLAVAEDIFVTDQIINLQTLLALQTSMDSMSSLETPEFGLEESANEVIQLLNEGQHELLELMHKVSDQNVKLKTVMALQHAVTNASQFDPSEFVDKGLEEAVELAEQQRIQFGDLRQCLNEQNGKLKNLSQCKPLTAAGGVECAVPPALTSYTGDQLADAPSYCEDVFELSDDMVYNMAVKVRPLVNCSTTCAMKLAIKELLPSVQNLAVDPKRMAYNLQRHFNVVEMYGGVLTTQRDIEKLHTDWETCLMWPITNHFQQDMALCVIMKRYEFTLAEYLASHSIGILESSLLLVQLLEAVVHLNTHRVCHRDLTSDNILIEMTNEGPHLVIADFEHSLRFDGVFRSQVPFLTEETCKGGNGYLMAPEIANARPFSFLNYSKSDLWTCGTISYEIFGACNPFFESRDGGRLSSASYVEDALPDLPASVPHYLCQLVKLMLKKDPDSRPDAAVVANALHILLWGPKQWLTSLTRGDSMPSGDDVRRWLVHLGAITYCMRLNNSCHRRAVSTTLQGLFLSRIDATKVFEAVRLLWCECSSP